MKDISQIPSGKLKIYAHDVYRVELNERRAR